MFWMKLERYNPHFLHLSQKPFVIWLINLIWESGQYTETWYELQFGLPLIIYIDLHMNKGKAYTSVNETNCAPAKV